MRGRAELRAFVVQVRVLENHQNGKDTHVRGVQVFAKDERSRQGRTTAAAEGGDENAGEGSSEFPGLTEPDWMRDPEIR